MPLVPITTRLPNPRSFGDRLGGVVRASLLRDPHAAQFRFLPTGRLDTTVQAPTNEHLDRVTRACAARLQESYPSGSRILIICDPGLSFLTAMLGCAYAGMVAVPIYPPLIGNMARAAPRITAIVADCEPTCALVDGPNVASLATISKFAPVLATLRVHRLGQDDIDGADRWREPDGADGAVVLQYTSGSTGRPRGVLVRDSNLLANFAALSRRFLRDETDALMSWLPPYHDMGLVGCLLFPAAVGLPVTLISPMTFLKHPISWLQLTHRTGATISGGPDFAYALTARRAKDADVEALDLRAWRLAFSGAEPVRPRTLEGFAARFAPAGFSSTAFYPCYGLAENTLIVTGGAGPATPRILDLDPAALREGRAAHAGVLVTRLVSCGSAIADHDVVIVDPVAQTPRGDREVGEVWVRGPCVGRGYWNRPELTEKSFAAVLADGTGPFLRTGDLGFLDAGELFVTGRIKDVIIVAGHNHYPHDIEATVESVDPELRPGSGVAVGADFDDGERLVIIQEASRRIPDFADVARRIRAAVLQEHGVAPARVVLIPAGTVAKTSSGKLQRRLTLDRLNAGELSPLLEWEC